MSGDRPNETVAEAAFGLDVFRSVRATQLGAQASDECLQILWDGLVVAAYTRSSRLVRHTLSAHMQPPSTRSTRRRLDAMRQCCWLTPSGLVASGWAKALPPCSSENSVLDTPVSRPTASSTSSATTAVQNAAPSFDRDLAQTLRTLAGRRGRSGRGLNRSSRRPTGMTTK
jgi:hypothetical protein